jgi:hypothetical protein
MGGPFFNAEPVEDMIKALEGCLTEPNKEQRPMVPNKKKYK